MDVGSALCCISADVHTWALHKYSETDNGGFGRGSLEENRQSLGYSRTEHKISVLNSLFRLQGYIVQYPCTFFHHPDPVPNSERWLELAMPFLALDSL